MTTVRPLSLAVSRQVQGRAARLGDSLRPRRVLVGGQGDTYTGRFLSRTIAEDGERAAWRAHSRTDSGLVTLSAEGSDMYEMERSIANRLTPDEQRRLVDTYEVESDEVLDTITSSELTVRILVLTGYVMSMRDADDREAARGVAIRDRVRAARLRREPDRVALGYHSRDLRSLP